MSCVHYKYRNSLDYDTITFDGLHITLDDLRQAIAKQKKLGKSNDFILQVINAQTKEEYRGENTLIPRNASVIVRRVPVGTGGSEDSRSLAAESQTKSTDLSKAADLSKAMGTEEEKMKAMMAQSTEDYDPSKYQKIRYRAPSSSYVCFRCSKPGHHIRNCPMNGIKRATGIPKIFMKAAESADVPGAMITAGGKLAVPVIDSAAYSKGKRATDRDFPVGAKVAAAPVVQKVQRNVPEEMICPLCRKLMTDAVLIPCCGRSYCDDCIRNYLLENKFVCPEPDCKQNNVSPDNLIPNRSLRKAINNFRNGVSGAKGASGLKPSQTDVEQKPKEEEAVTRDDAVASKELQSKKEDSRKKSPIGGDVSRDSTPEADSELSKPPDAAPAAKPRVEKMEPFPHPVPAPVIHPMPGYLPRPGPMYPAMVEVPGHGIPYPPVLPPGPVPLPFAGPQPPFPGPAVGPGLVIDHGHMPMLDEPPPMSADEFYRRKLEMMKQMAHSSSSYSSRSSSSSRQSSFSRSPSSSRSLSYSPRRHRSKRYNRSRSRSLSMSKRRRRGKSPASSHRSQSGSHRISKHRHQDSGKRTGRHRRRKSPRISRTPVKRYSRSPHYDVSRSGSQIKHGTESRSKHRKRSRSASPENVKLKKKEKSSKHSRENRVLSARKDNPKIAERERKRARLEKVKLKNVATESREFREQRVSAEAPSSGEVNVSNSVAMTEAADVVESDPIAESLSLDLEHTQSPKLCNDPSDSHLSETEEKTDILVQQQQQQQQQQPQQQQQELVEESESSSRDLDANEAHRSVEIVSDRLTTKSRPAKAVDRLLKPGTGLLKAAVMGAIADAQQHQKTGQFTSKDKTLKRQRVEQRRREVSCIQQDTKGLDPSKPVVSVKSEEMVSKLLHAAKAETEAALKTNKKVVIRHLKNLTEVERPNSPIEKRPEAESFGGGCIQEQECHSHHAQSPTEKVAASQVETEADKGDIAAPVASHKQGDVTGESAVGGGSETEHSAEVIDAALHEVKHKNKMKKKKHHKHHKHRRHSKSKYNEGSREEIGEMGDSESHLAETEAM